MLNSKTVVRTSFRGITLIAALVKDWEAVAILLPR